MEYPVQPIMTAEDMEQERKDVKDANRISALDPDFLCFAMPIANIADFLQIILTAIAILGLAPTLGLSVIGLIIVSLIIDVWAAIPIFLWMKWRNDKSNKAIGEQEGKIQERLQKQLQRLKESPQETEKIAAQNTERIMARETGEVATRTVARETEEIAAKTATKPTSRILVKVGGIFLLKIPPLIGCIPFWTIMVGGMIGTP